MPAWMSCSLCVRHGVHILLTTKVKCYNLFCPGADLTPVGKPAATLACRLQQLVRRASIGPLIVNFKLAADEEPGLSGM